MTKNCELCNCKLTWIIPEVPDYISESSVNIDGWSICRECMVEHCVSTNCFGCDYGKYPDCQFLEMKKHYMNDND